MMQVHLYSDGGCFNHGPNKGRGAWAYILVDNQDNMVHSDSQLVETETTNNRMEYISFMEGLKYCLDNMGKQTYVTAYSDSQLLVNTWNTWLKGWIAKGIVQNKANPDLLTEMSTLKKTLNENQIFLTLKWVRGHSGNKWNEECDRMCTKAFNS